MKKVIKIIGCALCSLGIAFIVETLILQLTDNRMYVCPADAVSIVKGNQAGFDLNDLIAAEENRFGGGQTLRFNPTVFAVRTLYLDYGFGGALESVSLYDAEQSLLWENTKTAGSRHFLIEVPPVEETLSIVIKGNCELKDLLVSSSAPDVGKKKVYNPLRMMLLAAAYYFLITRWKDMVDKVKNTVSKRNKKCGIFVLAEIVWALLAVTAFCFIEKMGVAGLSFHHKIFWLMTGMGAVAIVFYAVGYIREIETLYLAVSVFFVTCSILIHPVFVFGGDSWIHLKRTLQVAQEYDTCEYLAYYKVMQPDGQIPRGAMYEAMERANEEPICANTSFQFKFLENTRYVAYLTFAAGFVIGDALNFTTYQAFLLSELVNGWFVCLLYYLGMRKLKSGKLVLAVFSLLPYLISFAGRYSYTPQIIAWISFYCAYVIGKGQEEALCGFDKKDALVMALTTVGLFPKAPYLFCLGINGMIAKDRFKSRSTYIRNRIFMCAGMLALFLTLLLPMFLSGSGMDLYSDKRGGEGVDAMGQALFILANPLWYAKVLVKNLARLLSPASSVFGELGFTSFGAALNYAHVIFPYFLAGLFLFVILTDYRGADYLDRRGKWTIWLLTIGNLALICTLMYMNYSEVGTEVMQGINPVYFLTFLFPLFYSLGISSISKRITIHWRWYNTAVLAIWMGFLYASYYTCLVVKYV